MENHKEFSEARRFARDFEVVTVRPSPYNSQMFVVTNKYGEEYEIDQEHLERDYQEI